ncbi:polysaccharide biosynthesis tyrosine autokinase [Polaribacter aestuariivivens]|uniref:Polysaccharide biosynthesis tyrosine autokinase n=1 Tax=Polaribacter aestuariivivens TaxID=2304626 RepID=A0A5S3N1B0_9FLAO|nr:polysaccharide biosynthesis tyrosine autokinase [Polaribacter aestuariivivens]TMM29138.1 polysaccharide biosynthesis tyrosine autokinase [Polaribacter aestuariivivens]
MQKTNNFLDSHQDENTTLNMREEIEKYLLHWKWFILGVLIAFFVAFLYLRYTSPKYSATATIMIKDNQKSGISKELEAFKDMGIVGGGSSNNTDNEIEIIRSRKIIGQVVDSLSLDIIYYVEGRVIKSEIYNTNPITLQFISKDSTFFEKDTVFTVSQKNSNEFFFKNSNQEIISSHYFGEDIKSKIGVFKIEKLNDFNQDVFIQLNNKSKVIDGYRNRLNISPVNKNSSVLMLSIDNGVRAKAEDFLDELVRQYNIDAINDKSEVSKKTRDFIVERIKKIGQDLSKIQDSVKNFKDDNNITGLSMEGQLVLENASKNNEKIIDLSIELNLAKGIYENLSEKNYEDDETLPSNLGFNDISISKSILSYNELVSKKNALRSAGDKNPKLIQYKREIISQRKNLIKSIKNLISSLESQLSQINKSATIANTKVSSIPTVERGFIDIARQQEIISGLFSYLLKKKEETDISLAVTVPNAKIIDVAYSSENPVSPKRKIIYLAALFLGLLIPFIIIYLINLLDTKVHNKKDIENILTVPFLGDIPRSETKEKIIVGHDVRSSGSEAFRLIRTNLDFMLANNTKTSKFIFITSTTSGEGKSFISINLAATLALSGKRVLLMGMDLRAPKVTEYLGIESRKGVTNYITNKNLTLDDIKFNIPEAEGLDIISSGAIPPNPAELLVSKSVENLFDEVKNYYYYDYVIVDTAPVNLVTDTLLIAKYADMFLYVVRANYLDKRLLAVPEELYRNKRLPNMSIVLNDTDPKRSYGYGYGGYGYGYLTEQAKPWYKRIFSK